MTAARCRSRLQQERRWLEDGHAPAYCRRSSRRRVPQRAIAPTPRPSDSAPNWRRRETESMADRRPRQLVGFEPPLDGGIDRSLSGVSPPSRMALLNPLIASPSPLPSSGSFFPPNRTMQIRRIREDELAAKGLRTWHTLPQSIIQWPGRKPPETDPGPENLVQNRPSVGLAPRERVISPPRADRLRE